MPPFPSQRQLVMPLLEVLDAAGGAAQPADAIEDLAARTGISAEARDERGGSGSAAGVKAWDRHVRWVRQRAVLRGLIARESGEPWRLSEQGRNALRNARPGIVVTVYETTQGVALWADCESAVGYLEDGLVNLILTSPPYPLLRKKAYGNPDADAWVAWMVECLRQWRDKLADDGSVILNLGDAWEPGRPTLAPFQEALIVKVVRDLALFHLAQRLYWENPAKMPAPAEWVTVRRVRLTPSVEQIYWLSKRPHPKADNRRVLRAYSAAMRRTLAAGGEARQRRPSGHDRADGAFGHDRGGSIAHTLLTLPNTASRSLYLRACRARGLPIHPARFPDGLPEFFIRLLTEEGDVVWDPCGGSGVTGEVCERLGRHWITSERSLTYVEGSATRFDEHLGFTRHLAVP